MGDGNYFVYGGAYSNLADAQVDFDSVKGYYNQGTIGGYEAAVFSKGADGSVDIVNTETPKRGHGAAWGAATGALVGIVFPITFLVGAPVATAAAGGAMIANWSKAFGRDDIRKMGETLDQGQSGIVVVAEVMGDLPAERLLSRAASTTMKAIPDAKAVHEALKSEG
jgi:uncharacterized membrane protein